MKTIVKHTKAKQPAKNKDEPFKMPPLADGSPYVPADPGAPGIGEPPVNQDEPRGNPDPAESENVGSEIVAPTVFDVDAEHAEGHSPVAGGSYISYADGYRAFSPAEAFEDGYTLPVCESRHHYEGSAPQFVEHAMNGAERVYGCVRGLLSRSFREKCKAAVKANWPSLRKSAARRQFEELKPLKSEPLSTKLHREQVFMFFDMVETAEHAK